VKLNVPLLAVKVMVVDPEVSCDPAKVTDQLVPDGSPDSVKVTVNVAAEYVRGTTTATPLTVTTD